METTRPRRAWDPIQHPPVDRDNDSNDEEHATMRKILTSHSSKAEDMGISHEMTERTSSDDDHMLDVEEVDLVMTEVPIDGHYNGMPEGSSLPSPEEMRAKVIIRRDRRGLKRALAVACLAIAVSLVVIVGLSVGLKHSSSEEADSASTGSSTPATPPAPVPAPSPVVRQSTMAKVHDYLLSQGVATRPQLNHASTAQARAALWMALTDPLNLPVPNASKTEREGYLYLSRYALAVLYLSTNVISSTVENGTSKVQHTWVQEFDFVSGEDICNWNGVWDISGSYFSGGHWCDDTTGLPSFLYLEFNNLRGTVPTEIGLLTTLKILDLRLNGLNGPLPTELCRLTDLTHLAAGYNNLTGNLLDCIGQDLQQLQFLFVGNNQLMGAVPSSLAQLSQLQVMVLDDNMFTGPLSVFENMSSLSELYAESNLLTGSLTDTFMITATNLTRLDLSNNNITSDSGVPRHFFTMPNLQILDLSHNSLHGGLQLHAVGTNRQLQFLALHNNFLSGGLNGVLSKLQNLTHLDLSSNKFRGEIHPDLGYMTQLEYLFLAQNPALQAGPIPSTFGQLTKLRELSLKHTRRNGTLPEFIANLTSLTLLDLDENDFSGSIPTSWGELEKLQYFLINRNEAVTGTVPTSFSSMSTLRTALLDGTNLTGSLAVLCNLPLVQKKLSRVPMVANCGMNQSGVNCACCVCCDSQKAQGKSYCAAPEVANLEGSWEQDYGRAFYDFGSLNL